MNHNGGMGLRGEGCCTVEAISGVLTGNVHWRRVDGAVEGDCLSGSCLKEAKKIKK